jgi:hypothetical protein
MKRISWRSFIAVLAVLLTVLAAPSTHGQEITIDSISGYLPGSTTEFECGQPIEFVFRLTNAGATVNGAANGFRVYSPDGATWSPGVFVDTNIVLFPSPSTTYDTTLYGAWVDPPEYAGGGLVWKGADPQIFDGGIFVNYYSDDDNDPGTAQVFGSGSDTVGFAGFNQETGIGIFTGFDGLGWKVRINSLDCASHTKTICIDSAFFRPAGVWKWSTSSGDVFPAWAGPQCFTIINPNAPAEITVSPDSLHFAGIEGGGNPASQVFTVSSAQSVPFTITESIPWLLATPLSGSTNSNITVTVNTGGLPAGEYVDSIRVDAPGVPNSPQYVVITLSLVPPPPSIGYTPTSFFFNAVAGEANPPAKTLTITNAGGSTLNWTVTNSQAWLSLTPSSGMDSGDVSVEVDITSLPFGEYDDTIVVSDPAATNDPVKIPVHLSIGSDLPIIVTDSARYTIIVPYPTGTLPNLYFKVLNGGQGTMSFTVSENTPRIKTVSPTSGVAGDSVRLTFQPDGAYAFDGADYFDTVWISSNEAINSPHPMEIHFVYRSNPKNLFVFPLTLSIDYYECTQGAGALLPSKTFLVQNTGGDDPLKFYTEYESDYFTLNVDSATAPQQVKLQTKTLDLPLGTYYDTIKVWANAALNSPRFVIVELNVIEGTLTPQMVTGTDSLTVILQELVGTTFPLSVTFSIDNQFGGCMPWEIQENVPFMTPFDTLGDVPGSPELEINASGYTLGTYADSFVVNAPSASNTPQVIQLVMKIYKLRGDMDWDGEITIADVTYFVKYSFLDGPVPMPEVWVGDVDCNRQINIADLTYLVAYMFKNGPKPCRNP